MALEYAEDNPEEKDLLVIIIIIIIIIIVIINTSDPVENCKLVTPESCCVFSSPNG